jgi:hypothetical protein
MKLLILRARAQTKKDLMIYIALLLGFFFFTGPAPTNVHAEKIEPNDKRETLLLSEYNDSFF